MLPEKDALIVATSAKNEALEILRWITYEMIIPFVTFGWDHMMMTDLEELAFSDGGGWFSGAKERKKYFAF